MMTSRARWCVLAAVALLASAYVLPLWRVELIAPQYPEGLGMLIRVNRVEGLKPHDLNSINILNHYIGMQAIEPDAIPELKYMPWILAGLIVGGLVVAAWGRRVPLYVWGGALALILVAGLYDYWRWGYRYGHDLNRETAIIKIPGMTYQPPLIGSKKLLNFYATSWPASGGIALTLAAGLTAYAVFDGLRRRRRGFVAVLAFGAVACAGDSPRALLLGTDACAYCRMTVTDARFGTQVVTRTGKVEVFDSVECLAGYVRGAGPGEVRAVWVTDAESRQFVRADSAGYLLDGSLRGPMGRVVAFASPAAAEQARATLGGTTMSWTAVTSDSAGVLAHRGS